MDEILATIDAFEPNEHRQTMDVPLPRDLAPDDLTRVLAAVARREFGISFHDELYPSPSDPGAYFAYRPTSDTADEDWEMTCGNHGWSRGIHRIRQSTLLRQLHHLVSEGLVEKVELGGVGFLSFRSDESEESNVAMDEELLSLHT